MPCCSSQSNTQPQCKTTSEAAKTKGSCCGGKTASGQSTRCKCGSGCECPSCNTTKL
ncbi:BN860_06480g1_1 [Zygosaccharomyces bailii CLIB 213]|uniref:BN860_06480g1_1 n=1 Tax=Zygosaccharomyces bailii (strain CLIB 213 / ATCC 58445 / CBS 680 / BCRC 21525 / NBRC 1098 / NCYC 1416 / NRRL Y-2227) TaxID=1333698 RepID=A0A8J2X733_ZYGB2|nr:BN860_06480g1_1 [Zygosaccharomyces bailii CLIB 213]